MQATIERCISGFVVACLAATGLCQTTPAFESPASDAGMHENSPQQQQQQQRQQRGRPAGFGRMEGVYRAQVTPHWFAANARFWYRNDLQDGAKEFVLVDVEKGVRTAAFDHAKLAAALSRVAGGEVSASRLPFSQIEFSSDGKTVQFSAHDKTWKCDLNSYDCSPVTGESETKSPGASPAEEATTPDSQRGATELNPETRRSQNRREPGRSVRSPDGKWTAFVKDHNVFIRPQPESPDAPEGDATQLSKDGEEGNAYGRLEWSADSRYLAAWRTESGERKEVYLVRSSPPGGGRAQLESRPYALPGDKFTEYELSIFDVANHKQAKPEVERVEHEWLAPRLHWNLDGRHFTYQKVDRGHQRLRVIEVDSQTGATRNVIDERSDTFIWTAHTENLRLALVNWLEKTDEIIYASESDGWRHLYLVDVKDGKMKQLTKGEWVVRGIERIDEDSRQIWFTAGGRNADQDPYFLHYYRVNFDGSGLVALTEGNGNHSAQFSPDRKYIVDTYSRVDSPPVTELRRTADGKLVCKLEETDVTEWKANGGTTPEVFVAKGRDGRTDIWGVISRPRNFDAKKKYPVLESIYAGPQGSFVPKAFGAGGRFSALTDLDFVVVQIDGMGTANRSKAFHDVCWKNLKDGGFADRILWMKAAAEKRPWMDLTRVGVYGNSAGGQNAAAAVLFHPEFYKAAVANCGCHDNRMDKASWNEQWMGYPVGPQYAECSNIENAHRLQGKLFLIVGEMDHNVPPESTMRFADALIKAGKDFELLVVPNADHGISGPNSAYAQRRLRDFFVRHLQGIEPPARNAVAGGS